jgi:AbrB family looped-hinge helix DNA binding protein
MAIDLVSVRNRAGGVIAIPPARLSRSPAMVDSVTLSEKYQISIPKAVREAYGFQPGQKFAFVPNGHGGLSFVRVPAIDEMIGSMEGANPDGYRDRNDRY